MLSPGRFVILSILLLGPSEASLRAQENRDDPHRTPRATVRTLLTTITIARRTPRLIQEAAACLDLSGLPADQQDSGGLLATQLEAVLRARDIDTQLVPDEVKEPIYVLPGKPEERIALHRLPDGRWLFDPKTVALIPRLYADTQKQRQEKNREAAALNVAPEYGSARATLRTIWEAFGRRDIPRILSCLDLSEVPTVAQEEVGIQLAGKLRQIVVRHKMLILQEFPDSNFSDPHIILSQPEGVIELVRLPSGPRKGEWLFSRDTVRSIDKLYVTFEDKPYLAELQALGTTSHLPNPWVEPELWLRSLLPGWLRAQILSTRSVHLEVYELLGCVLVPVLAFGLHRLTVWLLTACVRWALVRTGWTVAPETIRQRLRPTGCFAGVLFLRWGLLLLGPDRVVLVPLLAVLNPLAWLVGMWAAFRLIDLVSDVLEAQAAGERRPEISQMFWPVASLALKIGLLVFTLFRLMALFSWDVTTVLTGLGIGGLAFALGAQDSLKNLFGSFTLIADRPFVVGESVKIGNHEVGVVEVVGLRSTRIRTAEDTLLIVPNSSLTSTEITNYGRRRFRRYLTRIGVAYANPPERLIAFRDGIGEIIRKQPCTRKSHFEVSVNELGAKAIEVLVNVYFEVADRAQELAARDELILAILGLAEELKIERA